MPVSHNFLLWVSYNKIPYAPVSKFAFGHLGQKINITNISLEIISLCHGLVELITVISIF